MAGLEMLVINESRYQFGDWKYDPVIAQLERDEQATRLQPRLAKLLSLFLANQSQLLTREQLIDALWGEKAINEDALSRCVAELRSVLGDKSQAPVYIQTLPKKGYRFICEVSVEELRDTDIANTKVEASLSDESNASNNNHALTSMRKNASKQELDWLTQLNQLNKNKNFWLLLGAFLLAIGLYQSQGPKSKNNREFAIHAQLLKTSLANSERLTTDANIEFQPDISRQGDKIAYLIRDNEQLIVRVVDRHAKILHEIRDDSHHLFSPKFSPDGRSLAIGYIDGKKCDVYLVALPSLQKTRLTSCIATINSGIFDWSSDGRYLAYVAAGEMQKDQNQLSDQEKAAAIWIFDIQTKISRQITSPEIKQEFDSRPVFAPNGRSMAFTRGSRSIRNVYHISIPTNIEELGASTAEPKALTQDNGYIVSLAWLKNGSQIVFDSNKLGDRALWLLDAKTKEQSILGARDAQYPSIDTDNNWMVYKEVQYQANIWSAQIPLGLEYYPISGDKIEDPKKQVISESHFPVFEPFISAIKYNNHPKFSPDRKSVAFVSNRKGKSSLWLYSIAERTQKEILSLPEIDITTPNWSKDGSSLLVSARGKEGYHCYQIEASSGIYRQVLPSISTLHGCSFDESSGIYAVVKSPGLPSLLIYIDQTGQTQHLTDYAISRAYPIGAAQVVFSKPEQDGLYILNTSTNQVQSILPEFDHRMDEQWMVRDDLVYYAEYIGPNTQGVWRYNLKTKQKNKLTNEIPSAIGLSLEVSPDHQQLLMVKTDSKVGNIYLAKVEALNQGR